MSTEDLQLLPTYTMPHGTYQGRAIADLPGNYLPLVHPARLSAWQAGQLLALTHELDHPTTTACPRCSHRRTDDRQST